MLDDKPKALASLRAYAAKHPDDTKTAQVIAAIESGAIEKVEKKRGDDKPGEKPGEKPAEKKDAR